MADRHGHGTLRHAPVAAVPAARRQVRRTAALDGDAARLPAGRQELRDQHPHECRRGARTLPGVLRPPCIAPSADMEECAVAGGTPECITTALKRSGWRAASKAAMLAPAEGPARATHRSPPPPISSARAARWRRWWKSTAWAMRGAAARPGSHSATRWGRTRGGWRGPPVAFPAYAPATTPQEVAGMPLGRSPLAGRTILFSAGHVVPGSASTLLKVTVAAANLGQPV